MSVTPNPKNVTSSVTSIDHTVGGKCSGCATCCSDILLLSDAEISKIKKYIKQHNDIKPINYNGILIQSYENICPFKTKENTCMVYEVRPDICKRYICSHHNDTSVTPLNYSGKNIISMHKAFLGVDLGDKGPDLKALNNMLQIKKKAAGIKD